MAWNENISNKIEIETGDGKIWQPQYEIGTFEKEFNHSIYEFPELSGSLVDKQLPKGIKFKLVLYFQGPNHIENFASFNVSTNDRRPWKVYHPIKGLILCQPIVMRDTSEGLSLTKVEIELITTIEKKPVRVSQVPEDEIKFTTENNKDFFADSYSQRVENPTAKTKQNITSTLDQLEESSTKLSGTEEQLTEFKNAVSEAKGKLNSTIGAGTSAINSIIFAITAPALFTDSVKARMDNFKNQLDTLLANLKFLKTPEEKTNFETLGATYINAMVITLSNPITGDYNNSSAVVQNLEVLTSLNTQFTTALDDIQTSNGLEIDSYIPDYVTLTNLENAVNLTASNLIDIALTGQLEKRFILTEDSNPILLTHRLYGLRTEENLTRFMNENDIGLSKILQIKKGTEIVYYE